MERARGDEPLLSSIDGVRMNVASPASFLVHVSSTQSREIHAFLLDAQTGSLQLFQVISVPGTGAPTRGNIPLAWNRERQVLYAHVRAEPFPLSAFVLEPASGRLRLLETVAMPAPLAYLSVMREAPVLLGASYDAALLTVNRIEANGQITPQCQQTLPTPPKAHCVIEAPFGGFVYATSVDGDAVLLYRMDPTSRQLEVAEPVEFATRKGAGPRHLVFHPTLDRLYCVNEHDGSLTAYRVDRISGALQEQQCEPLVPPEFSGNALASDIHFTPGGAFVYASVRNTHSIVAFRVDSVNGWMSRAGTFEAEANPRGFAIDPGGRFLLCAGQDSNQLAVYAIDSGTGGLSLLQRYAVGKRPSWIEIVAAA